MTRDPYHTDPAACGHEYHDDRDRIDQRRNDERPRLGPDRDEIHDALTNLTDDDPTDTPSVSTARVLEAAEMLPVSVEDRRVIELSITRGRTGIGAGHLRSDDHISDYVVEYDDHCEECDRRTRHRHEYHANHHIAGHLFTRCKVCGHEKESEEWH